MKRRHLLAALGAAAVAGCVGDAPAGSGDDATETDGSTDADGSGSDGDGPGSAVAPSVRETAFDRVDGCVGEDEARVDAGADAVDVTGCVVGADGCSRAALGEVGYDGDAGALRIVVRTVEGTGDTEACTQALTPRGYEARVAFDGGLPGRVVVVHDDANGRRTVADVDLRETETPSAN